MSEMTKTQAAPQDDILLEVRNLKKYFPIKGGMFNSTVGQVKAVDGISFKLKRGTTMGLVGESGCGKSTAGRKRPLKPWREPMPPSTVRWPGSCGCATRRFGS